VNLPNQVLAGAAWKYLPGAAKTELFFEFCGAASLSLSQFSGRVGNLGWGFCDFTVDEREHRIDSRFFFFFKTKS